MVVTIERNVAAVVQINRLGAMAALYNTPTNAEQLSTESFELIAMFHRPSRVRGQP